MHRLALIQRLCTGLLLRHTVHILCTIFIYFNSKSEITSKTLIVERSWIAVSRTLAVVSTLKCRREGAQSASHFALILRTNLFDIVQTIHIC